jgi:hypothetical protein
MKKKKKRIEKRNERKKNKKRQLRERFAGETPPLTQQPFLIFFPLCEKMAAEGAPLLECSRMWTHM